MDKNLFELYCIKKDFAKPFVNLAICLYKYFVSQFIVIP